MTIAEREVVPARLAVPLLVTINGVSSPSSSVSSSLSLALAPVEGPGGDLDAS